MNARILKLAQVIAKLQSEYTDEEMDEAFRLLQRASGSQIRNLLETRRLPVHAKRVPLVQELASLREREPDTYALIESFRRKLEAGELLPSLAELRSFGVSLDKEFKPSKSRSETIPRVVRLLLQIPEADLRRIIEAVPTTQSEGSEAFLRLADGIIRGGNRSK